MHLDVLAVGAHPDDVELTCSGTLAKCVKLGYKVGICDLTEGELGTRGNRDIRAKEGSDAAKILGAHVRENLRIPDGAIEINEENRLKLIQLYRKYRPKVILIPHYQERHPDHVNAHYVCREAWFYSGLRKIETRLDGKSQEPWRPHNYFHYMQKYQFPPSFIVDITDVFDVRTKSIRAHKSQFYDPDSPDPQTVLSQKDFLGYIEARARFFGEMIGASYGEPFYSVEPVGVDDPLQLKFFKG